MSDYEEWVAALARLCKDENDPAPYQFKPWWSAWFDRGLTPEMALQRARVMRIFNMSPLFSDATPPR